jgi:hypothetical protein
MRRRSRKAMKRLSHSIRLRLDHRDTNLCRLIRLRALRPLVARLRGLATLSYVQKRVSLSSTCLILRITNRNAGLVSRLSLSDEFPSLLRVLTS